MKLIFIGQSKNKSIFLDIKTNHIYQTTKGRFLDMYGSRNSSKHIVMIVFGLTFFGIINRNLHLITFNFKEKYVPLTETMVFWFVVSWTVISAFFIMLGHSNFRPKEDIKPATQKQFDRAVNTNLININFLKKQKVENSNIYKFILIYIGTIISGVVLYLVVITKLFILGIYEPFPVGASIGIVLLGFFPGIIYLMLFQNNAVRWLLLLKKYQEGKLDIITVDDLEEKEK